MFPIFILAVSITAIIYALSLFFLLSEQGSNMIIFLSIMRRRKDSLGFWEDYIEVVPDES